METRMRNRQTAGLPDDQIEDSFQNLVSDNLTENISLIKRPIILYLFNPEDNIAKVQIEYLSPYAKEEELSNLITIEPQESRGSPN